MQTRNVWVLPLVAGFVFNPAMVALAQEKSGSVPQRVLIIRHAEKPADRDESVHLSPIGMQRAEELYKLFRGPKETPAPFPAPDFIFAAKNSKHSHRSVETVTPLAKKLKLTINANYADAEFAKLAQEILRDRKYAGKTILICWHHGMAPDLAQDLRAVEAPKHWKGEVFDRVWELTYNKEGKVMFRDLPQRLLSTDSEK